jgi:peptidoglycan/xylan/chitin deacetylase (PgdA/CDA1 family)
VQVHPLIKSGVYVTAHVTGLSRALALRYRGRGIIFALHSVTAGDAFYPDDLMLRCPAAKLEWILQRLRQLQLDFVTLDEAVARLEASAARPFVALTLDDGYADNLTHALPVMERFAAPFTVFVTTGMITREIDAWWFGVTELVRTRDRIELPKLGRFDCADQAAKRRAYAAITTAIHADFDMLAVVRDAIARAGLKIPQLVDREALTERQLRTLAQHPLVTIGGHTTTHLNLKRAAAATVRAEMADNRKFLQDITGQPIDHSAYPFGHAGACGAREAEISRALGFRTAVTTRAGTVFPEHRNHLHALPRVCLARDETTATLQCKLNGLSRAVNSRLGNPVAVM